MADTKTAAPKAAEPKTDKITISYELGEPEKAPLDCKATSSYKGEPINAYGGSWAEAKTNALARAKHLKSIGDPPAEEDVDLDTV